MKRFLALMCVSALVLGLSTGFDAEAKVKKARVKKIAKTERVAKSVDKDCDKAKAECKDAKACENKKAECKDAKACKGMKAECKDAKACDKAQMKDNKKQLLRFILVQIMSLNILLKMFIMIMLEVLLI